MTDTHLPAAPASPGRRALRPALVATALSLALAGCQSGGGPSRR